MIAQEILKAQAAFETNGYAQRGFIFRHFAEGWLTQTGVELVEAIAEVDSYLEAAEAAAEAIEEAAWDCWDILYNDEGRTDLSYEQVLAAVVRNGGNVDVAINDLM